MPYAARFTRCRAFAMTSPPAVSAQNLRFHYGKRCALDDVSFEVPTGEMFGLLGPNGSGKTTLFKLLATLNAVQEGTLEVTGTSVAREPTAVRRKLGIVFQHPSIDIKLTVAENLRHQGHLYGLSGNELEERMTKLLETFRLTERRDEYAEKLSGGLKRRVEVAKSLLHRPPVLLLDEPTTGFDPTARREFWDVMASVNQQEGTSILVTTHLMEEAERCTRLVILDEGKLVAEDSPAALKASLGEQAVSMTLSSVEVTEELAMHLRSALGVEVQATPGQIRLDVATKAPPELGPFLARVMEICGDRAVSVTLSQPSLEDVFFAKTGHPFLQGDVFKEAA